MVEGTGWMAAATAVDSALYVLRVTCLFTTSYWFGVLVLPYLGYCGSCIYLSSFTTNFAYSCLSLHTMVARGHLFPNKKRRVGKSWVG
jgi:hypothetical protein